MAEATSPAEAEALPVAEVEAPVVEEKAAEPEYEPEPELRKISPTWIPRFCVSAPPSVARSRKLKKLQRVRRAVPRARRLRSGRRSKRLRPRPRNSKEAAVKRPKRLHDAPLQQRLRKSSGANSAASWAVMRRPVAVSSADITCPCLTWMQLNPAWVAVAAVARR